MSSITEAFLQHLRIWSGGAFADKWNVALVMHHPKGPALSAMGYYLVRDPSGSMEGYVNFRIHLPMLSPDDLDVIFLGKESIDLVDKYDLKAFLFEEIRHTLGTFAWAPFKEV